MIAMRPILEQDVIDLLNNGRFEDEIDGYVIMNGAEYLGYALYRVQDGCTTVLACETQSNALVDGAVRACVAAGGNAGADRFCVNKEDQALAKWASVFLHGAKEIVPNGELFGHCT